MNRHTAQRLLAPLWRRMRLIVSRGTVLGTDAAHGMQRLRVVLQRGERKTLEYHEPYGFTARPFADAELIAGAIAAVRGNLVALLVGDRRHRPLDLEPGETCLYTDEGDEIRLMRGRVIRVIAGDSIDVQAPEVHVSGTLYADDVIVNGVSFKDHFHGGVESGSSNTGLASS